MWWPELLLAFAIAVLVVLFLRNSRKLREQIASLEKARERIETEERLVFDFLHTIGEALSADMRAEDLKRLAGVAVVGQTHQPTTPPPRQSSSPRQSANRAVSPQRGLSLRRLGRARSMTRYLPDGSPATKSDTFR